MKNHWWSFCLLLAWKTNFHRRGDSILSVIEKKCYCPITASPYTLLGCRMQYVPFSQKTCSWLRSPKMPPSNSLTLALQLKFTVTNRLGLVMRRYVSFDREINYFARFCWNARISLTRSPPQGSLWQSCWHMGMWCYSLYSTRRIPALLGRGPTQTLCAN